MKPSLNRRQFLGSTLAFSAVALTDLRSGAAPGPALEVLDTRVISLKPEYYHAWPTVIRRRNGQLVLVYSGMRESHVCPFGVVEMMTSDDQGATWHWPQVLLDGPIDDRDAGALETAKGTLLVASFTSLAYEPKLAAAEKLKPGDKGAWSPERLQKWRSIHTRLNAAQRRAELGQWILRSTDGGITWSARIPSVVNSPHGPIQLGDGRLLYPGRELWTGQRRVGVAESLDDGQTWRWLAAIPVRPGDVMGEYHELHGVEAAPGRIVVQIRNHNKANEGETLQTESSDGGKTWSVPRSIGVWGHPSYLQKLKDGRLLMTYGYRRDPGGNYVRVSPDQGKTWSEAMALNQDAAKWDFGYPSTVECDDGTLLSVWYESMKDLPKAVLRQVRWKLKA